MKRCYSFNLQHLVLWDLWVISPLVVPRLSSLNVLSCPLPEQTPNWTRIGAAWPHKDGKGFNIDLEYLPQKKGRIVLREEADQGEGQ